jgi:hypothetical protein
LLRVEQRAEAHWEASLLPASPSSDHAAPAGAPAGVKPEGVHSALVCGPEVLLEALSHLKPESRATLADWWQQLEQCAAASNTATRGFINAVELHTYAQRPLCISSTLIQPSIVNAGA